MSEVIYRRVAVNIRSLTSSDHHDIAGFFRSLHKRIVQFAVSRSKTYDLPKKRSPCESPSYSCYMDHIFPHDVLTGALCLRGELPTIAEIKLVKSVRSEIAKRSNSQYARSHGRAIREKDRVLAFSPGSTSVNLKFHLQSSQRKSLEPEQIHCSPTPIDRVVIVRDRTRTYPGRFRLKDRAPRETDHKKMCI